MLFEKNDLKPIEGIARLGAISFLGFFFFLTFPVSSFLPKQYGKVFKWLADFDPGKTK